MQILRRGAQVVHRIATASPEGIRITCQNVPAVRGFPEIVGSFASVVTTDVLRRVGSYTLSTCASGCDTIHLSAKLLKAMSMI
jgi:hypothetical protein